ncbi:MAG TPA: hypothetical protein DEH10_18700 [Pseudomonas sp.]|nr:hypothetical protein [Pseudomonas sp.]
MPVSWYRQTRCWRFGVSISLGGRATRCKSDRGIAESVKPWSRTDKPSAAPAAVAASLLAMRLQDG